MRFQFANNTNNNKAILIEISRSLGVVEGELKIGFSSINKRLDKINGEVSKHDTRINKVESENDRRKGVITIIGAMAGIAASFVLNLLSSLIKK